MNQIEINKKALEFAVDFMCEKSPHLTCFCPYSEHDFQAKECFKCIDDSDEDDNRAECWETYFLDKASKLIRAESKPEKLKLNLEEFSQIQDGAIFACGEALDSPDGINMARTGKMLRWVAVKGFVHDWTIYTHFANRSYPEVARIGDKVCAEENIRKLVSCDDEVFAVYRY